MNTDRLKLELKRALGPFVLLVLLFAAGIAVGADFINDLAGTKPWISYANYRVAFSDAKNVLTNRTELEIAGVRAGAVTGEQVVHGQAVLTLAVESRYAPLYRNAVVRIRPVTPLENMYIDITSRGTPSAGVLRGNEILPASQTISPVEISDVLDTFNGDTRERMATLLDELGAGLYDRGAELRASFEAVAPFLQTAARMSEAMAAQRQDLALLVHHFGGITEALSHRDQQLERFVTSTDSDLAALAHEDAPFSATIAQMPPLVSAMDSSFANLRTTESALDPALQSLEPAAGALSGGLNALRSLSTHAYPALVALRPAVARLVPLARALSPATDAVHRALDQLAPEAPQIDRSTTLIVPCETYIGEFVNRVMSLTKFGDGPHNYANARADVQVDFNTLGGLIPDPNWTITPPCFK
jgi:ABC-type transporter Mla subunit MlaD